MSADSVEPRSHKPEGWPSVVPRILARDPARLVAFLARVFDARGELPDGRPAELRIGDSIVMVSDASARREMPAFLYVYVADVDATWRRALEAGARPVESPADMPYGDRRCMVEDEWGNTWQIATRLARSS
jgi:uncharacterized glyoxalase superfamily protein PhnB